MPDARTFFHYPDHFPMRRGGGLDGLTLAWESWGRLNEDRSNAVLVLTGLSPDAHAASSDANPDSGWWEYMIGPGQPLDTDRWFILCINSLGSCKGSTGPASTHPGTGRPWGLHFPELALEDVANSARILVKELGIEQLEVVVGPSMGGMTVLAYQLGEAAAARNAIIISSAPEASPFATAIRSLQREAIRADRRWRDGRYHDGEWPVTGMRLARKIGMLSYRSAQEWQQRFGRLRVPSERSSDEPFGIEFEVESYLEAQAERFIHSFDPNCYLYLSRAMDWFAASDYGDSTAEALASCGFQRAMVIGVETDFLFPLYQQETLRDGFAQGGTEVTFHALTSIQGHDAFLVDQPRFSHCVREFMNAL